MTFEQTLAALQAMLGEEVEIAVGAADEAPALVGTWNGRLAAGSELAAGRSQDEGESFYFHLADDPGSGFFLHAEAFRGAGWLGERGSDAVLRIRSGPIALIVAVASRRTSSAEEL